MSPIPFKSYSVVLADPPWAFTTHSNLGQEKSASRHYDTMPTADIIGLRDSLQLDWVCAPDCLLFMWTTWNMLARGDAHAVMKGWGFEPKSGGSWFKITRTGKDVFATGYMFRNSCEPFLVGTRGNPGLPASRKWRDGFRAIRRHHSAKPDYLHRAIEEMYPGGPYLELFARAERKGWDSFGNQIGLDPERRAIEVPSPETAPLLEAMGAA